MADDTTNEAYLQHISSARHALLDFLSTLSGQSHPLWRFYIFSITLYGASFLHSCVVLSPHVRRYKCVVPFIDFFCLFESYSALQCCSLNGGTKSSRGGFISSRAEQSVTSCLSAQRATMACMALLCTLFLRRATRPRLHPFLPSFFLLSA